LRDSSALLVWHISDLHFSYRKRYTTENHCDELEKKFYELLSSRRDICKDIFVISGDCTATGGKRDLDRYNNFLEKLKSIGVGPDNILAVPGNHDTWFASFRLFIWLTALVPDFALVWLKKISFFRKFLLFGLFGHKNFFLVSREINNIKYNFCLTNSCVNYELARGVFPKDVDLNKNNKERNILILHHHITDLERDEFGIRGTIKKSRMKIVNPQDAFHLIEEHKIDLVLHGHKHYQYFSKERPYIISAPSLLEKKYDLQRGCDSIANMIGFNVLLIKPDSFKLYFLRLKNNDYCHDNIYERTF